MAGSGDIYDLNLPPLDGDDAFSDAMHARMAAILSPSGSGAGATVAAPPPSSPPRSGTAQSTPLTGSLDTAPQQAQPKVSGPAMIPGVAAKPEDLFAQQRARVLSYRQQNPGVQATAPAISATAGAATTTPRLPAATAPSFDKLGMQTQQDQARLADLTSSGSGISQVKNRWGRILGGIADAAGTVLAPGIAAVVPGSTLHHQVQLGRQQDIVANDQAQQQAQASLADTQSQTQQRNQIAQQDAAKASLDLSQAQADAPRKPTAQEAQQYGLDANALYRPSDIGRAALQANRPDKAPAEGEMPLGDAVPNLNKTLADRYQVLNPGKSLPPEYTLPANATQKDYDRIDKALSGVEGAQGTQAQLQEANALRQQAAAMAQNRTGDADPQLVQQIGTGRMPIGRMSYLLARNPKLLDAVSTAFPDFDASKIESYAATYKDFTSGKTSTALNAGATALGHLSELKALNTPESHVPYTPDWNAYQNKADTLATELAKFYGDATVPAIAAIKKTLTSTLPGNRERAIETQAQSMGDKFQSFRQQWQNAAPSSAYQAPMPGISDAARRALAQLVPGSAGANGTPANQPGNTAPNGQANSMVRNYQGHKYVRQANGSWRLTQ